MLAAASEKESEKRRGWAHVTPERMEGADKENPKTIPLFIPEKQSETQTHAHSVMSDAPVS
jgi:hypothetical protein